MNNKFRFNQYKTIHSILFILGQLGGKSDFHKIFKILYFADQKHLVEFGMPITGDSYTAMQNGPVPSKSYDIFKFLRGETTWQKPQMDYSQFFEVENWNILVKKQDADMDELADSNIEYLMTSIKENENLSFSELSLKSHELAWKNAINNEMSFTDIAIEGKASEGMVEYIKFNLENQSTNIRYAIG